MREADARPARRKIKGSLVWITDYNYAEYNRIRAYFYFLRKMVKQNYTRKRFQVLT